MSNFDHPILNMTTCSTSSFGEFTEVYQIEADFKAKIENEFNKMIGGILKRDGVMP